MPLRKFSLPEYAPAYKLTAMQAAAVFFTGVLFVLAPVPQLLVQKSSTLALLTSSLLSPAAGILIMSMMLIHFGGFPALQIRKLTLHDITDCIRGTLLIVLCYMSVNALWKLLLQFLDIPFAENQQLMAIAENCTPLEFFFFTLLVTVPVPIAEELLFRRILFDGLQPLGTYTALLITSAVFAAVHLFPAGLPGLFIIGAGFQWIYLRQKNLLSAVFCHAMLNGISVIAVLFTTLTGH